MFYIYFKTLRHYDLTYYCVKQNNTHKNYEKYKYLCSRGNNKCQYKVNISNIKYVFIS